MSISYISGNIKIFKIGESVIFNGYIPDDIPSYKKDDMKSLIFGGSYEILDISPYYDQNNDNYTWYRMKSENGYNLWYPSISFGINKENIKKKYGLK